MHFTHHLIIHLTVQSRSALENTFDGEPKDVLRDLHKDAQKGACDVAQKGHLRLHLNCTCCCTYMLQLKVHLRFHFQKWVSWKKKDAFDDVADGSLDDAIRGTPLNLKLGSLSVLYILHSTEQRELLTFSN